MQKKKNEKLVFSPTDLSRYFESKFSSWMDHYEKLFENSGPLGKIHRNPPDDLLSLLKQQGLEHESRVIDREKIKNKFIKIDGESTEEKIKNTISAMGAGFDLIYQGALSSETFFGYADILQKKKGTSSLGEHYYVPYDVKLSSVAKPTAIIQLLTYCDLLKSIQNKIPDEIGVITKDESLHLFSVSSFYHFFCFFRDDFLNFHRYFDPSRQPLPEKTKDHRDWSIYAKKILHEKDDVALTAKLRATHLEILKQEGIFTLTKLSEFEGVKLKGIPDETLTTLKKQAKLQVASKGKRPPLYEVLPHSGRMGLSMLPEQTDDDIFFDMEGYPLIGKSGLEYLYGFANRSRKYETIWAYSTSDEAVSFKKFVELIHVKWMSNRSIKIYHYGHYEPSTLKRLMGQYGLCERMIDDLLRSEVFVDLYQILKQSLLIGTYSYSLKSIESLYYPERETIVSSGADSAVEFSKWLIEGGDPRKSKFLSRIEDYNRDDCFSTLDLERFLRKIKKEMGINYIPINSDEKLKREEDPDALKTICSSQAKRMLESIDKKFLGLSFENADIPSYVCEQIAHCLDFVRREENPEWWDFFSLHDISQEDLRESPDALINVRIKSISGKEYICVFDLAQDSKFHKSSSVRVLENQSPNEKLNVENIDYSRGEIVLSGKFSSLPNDYFTLAPGKVFFNKDMILKALLKIALSFDKTKKYFGLKKCVHDILIKSSPDIKGRKSDEPLISGQNAIPELTDLVLKMNNTILCIQGPPGTGKTYTGSRIISELFKRNKVVAISSNSHKAMNHLALKVSEMNPRSRIIKLSSGDKLKEDKIQFEGTNIEVKTTSVKQSELGSYDLIVGTVYYLSKLENAVDYLFIDEATQVALPNLLAMANCTSNILLLGDQMQLEQPIKGAHPGESGNSALVHLTNGRKTVERSFGIFLETTYRMHPEICSFISEEFYDSRLFSHPDTVKQKILWNLHKQAGLLYMPIEHIGNTHASLEEVKCIKDLFSEALKSEWINEKGESKLVTYEDILIVAPYNHQVALLKEALPDKARVGTVDLFQGQEAAIVITSMCSSTLEDAPRGPNFLLNSNRINVAISRAKALSIVVGSPSLASGQSSSIASMKLISTYCHLVMVYFDKLKIKNKG